MKTSVVKTCNSEAGNTNCDLMDVVVNVYDKASGEKVISQNVKRVYTHFAESLSFTADAEFVLPEDVLGFVYESEGNCGSVGADTLATANLLEVRTKACATNYQPNSAKTACVACPAPSGTQQYRSGDCAIGTCPAGQKANSAQTGCVNMTCVTPTLYTSYTEPACARTYFNGDVGNSTAVICLPSNVSSGRYNAKTTLYAFVNGRLHGTINSSSNGNVSAFANFYHASSCTGDYESGNMRCPLVDKVCW